MNKEVAGGVGGTILSAIGTGLQTSEVLQIISLVLTIIGSLITIIMAVTNWWKKAKADGKITKEEIQEGIDIIQDGIEDLKDKTKKEDKEENK